MFLGLAGKYQIGNFPVSVLPRITLLFTTLQKNDLNVAYFTVLYFG